VGKPVIRLWWSNDKATAAAMKIQYQKPEEQLPRKILDYQSPQLSERTPGIGDKNTIRKPFV